MELDLSDIKLPGALPAATLVIVAGIVLALLGRAVSPDRLLTWSEWQVVKQSRAYTRELDVISNHANRLTELLNASPNAVRASVERDKACRLDGIPALAGERDLLCAAANDVLAWAQGDIGQGAAASSVEAVLARLEMLGSGDE
ncbi:hypothetical protein D6833_09610 [Candidatus Parcubacteria bacterium]|nr:MAG: hypothetical protein D6833_09610 [Candidatus Parcubacteria bacterium]